MSKNGRGIELKNGSGIEPSEIAGQIVPHDASAGFAFQEQLDRHANVVARYGTEWADRLVEEADRLVEEAEAAPRSSLPSPWGWLSAHRGDLPISCFRRGGRGYELRRKSSGWVSLGWPLYGAYPQGR